MNIIYAAGNTIGSGEQLIRICNELKTIVNIKTFGYSINNCFLDFCLDSLSLNQDNNDNLQRIIKLIELYKPDLIISDLNVDISNIGFSLNIPTWQVSCKSIFLDKNNIKKFNIFSSYICGDIKRWSEKIAEYENVLLNSNKVYFYSPVEFFSNIEFNIKTIKPYYKSFSNKKINKTAIIHSGNKIIDYNKYAIYSSNHEYDSLDKKKLYSLRHNRIIFSGETSYFADVLFNNIESQIEINYSDIESVMNYNIGKHFKLIAMNEKLGVKLKLNNKNINYLHEEIKNEYML